MLVPPIFLIVVSRGVSVITNSRPMRVIDNYRSTIVLHRLLPLVRPTLESSSVHHELQWFSSAIYSQIQQIACNCNPYTPLGTTKT